MKKVLSLCLVLTLTLGCFAFASASEVLTLDQVERTEPIEIVFWNSLTGELYNAVEALVSDYNASQSRVHVTSQFQGSYDETLVKLKASIASKTGPDVCHMNEAGMAYMIDSGYTVPVQTYMDATGYDMDQLNDMVRSYYSVGGTLWSMPFNYGQALLFYNKTAFEEAGLDPEYSPRTFEELADYSAKLMQADGDAVTRYGVSLIVYGWFMEQLVAGQGKYYVNGSNGRVERATALDDDMQEALLRVFTQWYDLNQKDGVIDYGTSLSDAYAAFVAGKVTMLPFVSGYYNYATAMIDGAFELGIGFMPMLDMPEEGGCLLAGASFWMIDSEDDVRKAAAWDFMSYMASAEAQAKWCILTGDIAVNKGAYEMDDVITYMEQNPAVQVALDQEAAYPDNYYTQGAVFGVMTEARHCFEDNMQAVLAGVKTPEQATQDFIDEINESIAVYNASTGA